MSEWLSVRRWRRFGLAGHADGRRSPPEGDDDRLDLALRRPGQAARQRALEEQRRIRRETPLAGLVARLLDLPTEERAWRIGASGEATVGRRLERLHAAGWHVLHAVPVGEHGADIDHLLVGPGGVFTINTKNHPGKRVWIGGGTVMVNGLQLPYLRNSRYEAERAAKLLSSALGRPIEVQAALVLLTGSLVPDVSVARAPEDVMILDRIDLPWVFRRAPERLDRSTIEEIFAVARVPGTWRQCAHPAAQDRGPASRPPQ